MTRTACLAFALVALAACDSAGPASPPPVVPPPTTPPPIQPPGPAPGVTYSAPPTPADGFTGEEDGRGFAFALASLFQTTGTVGTLAYAASPASGPVSARIDGDSLRISLVSAGTAFVSVTATSATGLRATGDIAIRSTGRCPAAVASGQVALLPDLAEGTEWHFTIAANESPIGYFAYRIRGTAVLRFGASLCSDGTRTQPVSQTKTMERSNQNPMTGVNELYGEPTVETASYTGISTATETRTTAPSPAVRNTRAVPPFGPGIPRSVGSSAFASGAYVDNQGYGSSLGPTVVFTLQDKVTVFGATTNYGTAGNGSLSWTRVLP